MNTIKECFNTILNSGKEESRQAARRVRKIVYSSHDDRSTYEEIKELVNNALGTYAQISDEWRQENFVLAVSVIYFLHGRENEPDFLFPLLFELIQHKNGYIRHAAVRMFEREIGPLTAHIRVPGYTSERVKPEHADRMLHLLFMSLNSLQSFFRLPKYTRYKYIDSLPPSPYKSIQMVLAKLEDSCGHAYFSSSIVSDPITIW